MAGRIVSTFKAIVVEKADGGTKAALTQFDEANLMDGDVTVRVEYSTVNYKDGLAITGKAPVVRRFPMIAGIDGAGTVEASSHPDFKPGDKVVTSGGLCGVVMSAKDETLILRLPPDNIKLEVVRSSVVTLTTNEEEKPKS